MLPRLYRTDTEKRRRQIDTLKIFNDNVVQIVEGKEYQIAFGSGKNELVLQVSLPDDFPNVKPILKLRPLVLNPWVNQDGEIISAPGLLNFTVHSDLGRVVQAIISEFKRCPPPLASETTNTTTSPSIPARVDAENIGRASPIFYNQNFSPPVHNHATTAANYQSTMFPELSTMSLDELQFLNDCAERCEEILENLPQNKEMNKTIDDIISQIEEQLESNLKKQSQLDHLQVAIDARMEEVTKLVFETERLNVTYQNLSDKYSPKNIKNQLLQAAEAENNASEKIAEDFLQGKMDVDKFVVDYLQKRSLGQTRKTKEEKLSQQLQHLERAGF